STGLAVWLQKNYKDTSIPVIVYGHKSAVMVLCFLACVKSGRAYCPLDCSLPSSRIEAILEMVNPQLILASCQSEMGEKIRVEAEEIMQIAKSWSQMEGTYGGVKPGETFYIIFTSGSTGDPKGVKITRDCLENYLEWAVDIGTHRKQKEGLVFLNQAPFSFDLSVMDLYLCLAVGGTLLTMEKETQADYKQLIPFLSRGEIGIWVSTPSFADICLADRKFTEALLPKLQLFLFCGETLTNNTANRLQERFPNAKIVNTYGPTESTVAVTEVVVTRALNEAENPLPVGFVKGGTHIEIVKEDGTAAEEGEKGEILILGNTVSTGYFGQPELTKKAFFTSMYEGAVCRGYHTGDIGYVKNQLLYYCGRMDSQVKLHGYRIEIGDIESNLLKLPNITHAAVIPNIKENKVKSLYAFLVEEGGTENSLEASRRIKAALKAWLPDYMIPKKIIFLEHMPVTANGKTDLSILKGFL
ncbi:MAG: D-alanine--poly(phosphoribitol) ligase subunit DltA, partial [Anaerovorax sp.]